MSRRIQNAIGLLAIPGLYLFALGQPVWADSGHEHAEPATPAKEVDGPVSVAGFGETFDITMIYSAFKTGDSVPLRIFLANLESNKPVSDAEILLTLIGPDTDSAVPVVPVPGSPGEYAARTSLGSDADYSFLVEVSIDDDFDLFSVDGFSTVALETVAAEETDSFSIGSFKNYFLLGGYVVVAFAAFSLGARSRGRANS